MRQTIEVSYFVDLTPRVLVGRNLTELCAKANSELPGHLQISVSGISRCVNAHSASGVHKSCRVRVFDDRTYPSSLVAAQHKAIALFVSPQRTSEIGADGELECEPLTINGEVTVATA
jgi:hypothetical protein